MRRDFDGYRREAELCRGQPLGADSDGATHLPLDIFRDANPTGAGRASIRRDARRPRDELRSQFNATLARDIVIAFRKRALDSSAHGTASRRSELEQESVADGFNLGAMEARQNLAHDATMFLEQLESEGFVALRHRAVTDHVGKHNGCELALFRGHG